MLKALYDYGLRRQLALPPGFVEKTVKAYISLSEDDDRVSIYLGDDDEPVPCPDIGSLANGRDKMQCSCGKAVRCDSSRSPGKRQSTFFLEALRRRGGGRTAAEGLRPCTGNA